MLAFDFFFFWGGWGGGVYVFQQTHPKFFFFFNHSSSNNSHVRCWISIKNTHFPCHNLSASICFLTCPDGRHRHEGTIITTWGFNLYWFLIQGCKIPGKRQNVELSPALDDNVCTTKDIQYILKE